MRIAVAGLFEEVNTFADETMGLATITGNMATGFQLWEGEALIRDYKGSKTYMGGFLDALAESREVESIAAPLYSFGAGPTIQGAAYQQMKEHILEALSAAMPLDAIALQLHGAGVAEGVQDVEGDLCAAIRERVGPDVKIVCALDHHCNLTDHHLKQMDLVTMVRHYPHIDMYEAAYRAGKLLPSMVTGTVQPRGHFEHLPLILSAMSTMDGNLHAPIRAQVEQLAKRKGIYELSFAYSFPFADVPFNSCTVNCWAESTALARATARELSAWVWERRQQFVCHPVSAAAAVERALSSLRDQRRLAAQPSGVTSVMDDSGTRLARIDEELARSFGFVPDQDAKGPVVIADKSDNPGAGAPGDSTHLLRELIERNVQQAAICCIRDPDTVKQAMAAGVGGIIDVELGGKASRLGGEPVRGKAYVKSISDGRYTIVSPMGRGSRFDIGPAVGLAIEGVDVVVVCGTMQPFDGNQMKMVGFDPLDYRIVVLKSANHFRAWWADVASEIVDCDTPGIASNDLTSFRFKNKTRKLYPLDAGVTLSE